MKAFRAIAGILILLFGLPVAAAPPVRPGIDIAPFGSQTVWPVNGQLATYNGRLQQAGIQWARFDLCWWSLAELTKGEFNFTSPNHPGYQGWNTDAAIADLKARGIEPFPILCYGNPHYDNGQGPFSDAGRAAFGDYCYAAASRYKDSVNYWEVWNEPNLEMFWGRAPHPADYARLVAVAAPRIRQANPNAVIAGGAVAGIDLAFLETAFQHGLLDHIDILTVHPYRISPPESINGEIATLRARMAVYTSRTIPIWTGEWGYNTWWSEVTPMGQAKCLGRMMVNNLSIGIGNSIWFSVHPFQEISDGSDPEWALLDYGLNPRPSWQAFKVVNDRLPAPVTHVGNPLGGSFSPAVSNQRLETFQRESERHMVVAVWQARWPIPDSYSGTTTSVRLNLPADATVRAYDGLSGAEVALTPSHSAGVTTLSNFRVRDYPIYLDIQIPDSARGDVDGDGVITPADAQGAFLCYVLGQCPDGVDRDRADLCATGAVTPRDAQAIFRLWLGLPPDCP